MITQWNCVTYVILNLYLTCYIFLLPWIIFTSKIPFFLRKIVILPKIYLSSAYNYKDNVFPLGFSVPTPWTSLPPLALVWTSTPRKIRTASSWKMPRNSSTLPSTHFYYWYVSFLMSMHVYMFLLEVGLGADECVRMWKQRECFIHYLLLEIQFLYIYFFNWDEQKVTNFYVLCIINKN